MAKRCSWCNGFIGDKDQYWYHHVNINGEQKKSKEKFCSPKCSYEYPHLVTPEEEGCFIATTVFCDYEHPVVLDLRNFRDSYLKKRKWGLRFINFYYVNGPRWANIIASNNVLRLIALFIIIKPLHFISKVVLRMIMR